MLRRCSRALACPASVPHPDSLLGHLVPPPRVDPQNPTSLEFRSDGWKHAMCRLYRVVLKSHEMFLEHDAQREFGDKFVKAEFRRHALANAKYASIFYRGWYDYVATLERGVTSRALTPDEQAMLSDEQKERLADLRHHVVQQKLQDNELDVAEVAGTPRSTAA